jgi:tRNA-modifying protein YgfZ
MTAHQPPRDSGVVGEIAGRPVLLHFGDVPGEYAALTTGALLVDRSYRARAEVTGPKAAEAVNGLVTNDVVSLHPGNGAYAAILSPKGKVLADIRIFRHADGVMLDAPPRCAATLPATLRKFINPRTAPHRDLSSTLMDVGVFGPRAAATISSVTGIPADTLMALPAYGHTSADLQGSALVIARVPDVSVPGFELFVSAEQVASLSDKLVEAGAIPGGLAAFEIARVEAGRPEWGIDIDDNTIPQEANFDELGAISYTKGCYTGQETVARVHFRGHVNRHLRGLRLPPGAELPAYKSEIVDSEEKVVGDIRSTALSPRVGPIALAMVRREIPLGASVTIRADGGLLQATVVALPFVL